MRNLKAILPVLALAFVACDNTSASQPTSEEGISELEARIRALETKLSQYETETNNRLD
ncbi:MAG: hypothetical protein JW841_01795 [Deltaproteobacteria bacterium]|nr:hypothetical protein [Deltaproteobacteria bacterium]